MPGLADSQFMGRAFGLEARPTGSRAAEAGFEVVGVGLPRSGTASLCAALGMLLDGPCFHIYQLQDGSRGDLDEINKMLDGLASEKDLIDFFQGKGFRAGQILLAFPRAKVVLTKRDIKEWFQSFTATVKKTTSRQETSWSFHLFLRLLGWKYIADTSLRPFTTKIKPLGKSVYGAVLEGKESAMDFAHQFEEHVKAIVPKERLLVFDVKEGWQPLCQFLGVEVPNEPFPRVNDRATFTTVNLLNFSERFVMASIAAAIALVAFSFLTILQ